MRPDKNIDELIKRLDLKASAGLDEKIHHEIDNASDQQQNAWNIIFQNRLPRLAAAAMIIVAISFFFIHQGPNGQKEIPGIAQTVDSPAELTTLASLSFAYRQGGMEMVEKVFDKALKQAGQRPANISMQEFLEEIDNGKSERTKL
jgi:hypothetical protein